MNRHQQFNESDFKKTFDQIFEKINDFDTNKISASEAKENSLRIKKIFTYIDAHIKLIDWDLLTQNEFNAIINQSQLGLINTALDSYIKDFNTNSLSYLDQRIDQCLLSLFQNVLQKSTLPKKKFLQSVYESYTNTLNSLLSQINEEDIVKKKNRIDQYYSELFIETDGKHSIQSQIEEFRSSGEKSHSTIQAYISTLFGSDNEDGIKKKIDAEKEEIFGEIQTIRGEILEFTNRQDDLNKFYIKIFGERNAETEEREGGLDQQLESDQDKFKEYKQQQEQAIETIKRDVKSHMENAMSVGLAKAFNREAGILRTSVKIWTVAFVVVLVVLTGLAMYFIKSELDWLNMLNHLPITLPLVWLAVFIGKRRSEVNRLCHEYIHKEVIANSYSSYKKQIEELAEDSSQDLLNKLLNQTVEIIGNNPSDTLDKKHSANLPAKEMKDAMLDKARNTK